MDTPVGDMPGPLTRDDPYSYEPPSNFEPYEPPSRFEHTPYPYPYPHEAPTQHEGYHRSAHNYAEELDDVGDYQVS